MKNAKSIAARLAGILIFALSPMALAEEAASVQPAGSVQIAQAENDGRYNDSRPVTVGDLHRLQDQQNKQMRLLLDQQNEQMRLLQDQQNEQMRLLREHQREQIGMLHTRLDEMNARMGRIEDELSHLGGRLDLALTVMLGGLLGIVAVLLARREKPAASARINPNASQAPAH